MVRPAVWKDSKNNDRIAIYVHITEYGLKEILI
jgi:hypothetical protein